MAILAKGNEVALVSCRQDWPPPESGRIHCSFSKTLSLLWIPNIVTMIASR